MKLLYLSNQVRYSELKKIREDLIKNYIFLKLKAMQ